MKKIISLCFVITLLFLMSGCRINVDSGKIQVVTTIFPIYDMARAIGSDKIDVSLMVSPGVDIHSYDPSTSDIISAKKADVLLYIGDTMESWIPNIISQADDSNQIVVKLTDDERIKLESLEHHDEHDHDLEHNHNVDMHIWTNPKYAQIMVELIRNALLEVDPINEDYYTQNALEYNNQIQEIIFEIENIVKNAKRNTLYFGSPFAFYYFTEEFGLEHYSIYDTCSIEVEPTIDKMVEINNLLKDNNIPVIYTKELLNDMIARKVIEGTHTEIYLLHSAHNVSVEEFNKGITYLGIWQNNLEALRRGLL